MVTVTKEQAKAIVDLANELEQIITPEDVLVGITTDGVPVARGIEYIFKCKGKECRVEYIGASSKLNFVDIHKLKWLEEIFDRRIYVDWRTVTGKLGEMLKEKDGESLYAVLSDPNNKADIRATTEDIAKFDFPDDYEQTMKIIGLWTEPHTVAGLLKLKILNGKIEYKCIDTEQSMEFYGSLSKSISVALK
ncbi:MAG: hypothetical protein NTY99_00890 [DPANN group archaeon]|nr:hypothetical protein [DPANN group archaeon]